MGTGNLIQGRKRHPVNAGSPIVERKSGRAIRHGGLPILSQRARSWLGRSLSLPSTSFAAASLSAILIVIAASSPASALEEFRLTDTKTFEVGSAPDINLETVNGDVSYTATAGTKATVDIIVLVRARDEAEAKEIRDQIGIRVEGSDGLLEAVVKHRRDFNHWLQDLFGRSRSISVSFHVHGPSGATGEMSSVSGEARITGTSGPIQINSVSGDVTAERVSSRVRATAVSGGVHVSDCRGPVHAETVSGDVDVDICGSTLKAETVSGSLTAAGVAGDVDASTTSGDILVKQVKGTVAGNTTSGQITVENEGGSFDLHSVSGDLTVRSAKSTGRLACETVSGSVKVYVNAKEVSDVRLSSNSGDIQVDAGLRVRKHSRHELSGRLGDGPSELEISTSSGDILLGEL